MPHSRTTYEDARLVLKILADHGFHSMFAGGCVRDRLLGRPPKDYDIATTALPETAQKLFNKLGFKVIPTGLQHGTITVLTTTGPVEITTLRKDIKTDGRHAVVEFAGASFEDDAARRDFTINAMFEDINGIIHDFHHGQDDLKNKILRFVGDPVLRIREDYLRILRFFRFWARLGFSPDQEALKAIESELEGLRRISQERITHELLAICSEPLCVPPIVAMAEKSVMPIILPEAVDLDVRAIEVLTAAVKEEPTHRTWLLLSLLLGIAKISPNQDKIRQIARRLRFSERDARTLMDLFLGWQELPTLGQEISDALDFAEAFDHPSSRIDLHDFYGPIWSFLARETGNIICQHKLNWLISVDQRYLNRRKSALPLNGEDVLACFPNMTGPKIGQILGRLKRSYRNGEWETRTQGLELLGLIKDSTR